MLHPRHLGLSHARIRNALHLLLFFSSAALVFHSQPKTFLGQTTVEDDLRTKLYVSSTLTFWSVFLVRMYDFGMTASGGRRGEKEKRRNGVIAMFWLEGFLSLHAGSWWAAILFIPQVSHPSTNPTVIAILLLLAPLAVLNFVVFTFNALGVFGGSRREDGGEDRLSEKHLSSNSFVPDLTSSEEGESALRWMDIVLGTLIYSGIGACLVSSLRITRMMRAETSAYMFIIPSILSVPLLLLQGSHYRPHLIILTSLHTLLLSHATASYTTYHLGLVAQLCNGVADSPLLLPRFGSQSSALSLCKLSQTLNLASHFTVSALVLRLAVMHLRMRAEEEAEKTREGEIRV